MKYALYCRKSTESEDRQALSIESQKTTLLNLAKNCNLDVELILEENKSAKQPGRHEFNKLIQLIDKGKIDGILCWKLDRLSRNPIDGGTISWYLQQGKIKKIFTHDREYLPSDNIVMMSVELGMANQYIRDLSVNVKRGLKTKAEKGGYCNKAPLGYLNDKANKTIVIDPERAKYITKIFELHSTGNYGYRDIATLLFKEGFRSHAGSVIYKSKIQQILSNPVYCGFVKYKDYVNLGTHQPIISKTTFDYAQEVSEAKLHPRKQNHFFPLRGFITCDDCGCMYTATKKKGHDYYYCTNGKGICTGHKKYLRENYLYGEVAKVLEKVPFDEELVGIMYEAAKQKYKSMENYSNQSVDTLKNELQTLKTRESRLLDALLDLHISKDDFEAKSVELRKKIIYLEKDIAELEEKLTDLNITLEPTKKFFLDCISKQKKFIDAEPQEKHQTAQDVLWNLSMKEEKVLSYKLKSPYDILARTPKNASIDVLLATSSENDNKSINVKRGLKTRVEMGLWPCPPPTGYLKEKTIDKRCQIYIDPDRGPIVKQMFEKVAYEKWSGRKLFHWLKFDLNFRSTSSNKGLTLSTIHLMLRNTFYYGHFEYPRKSGNWYKGSHEPLISKELFDQVQIQLNRDIERTEFRSKEFAFTRLMTCGLCGSGICADEKIKKSNNGNVHRYVYYGCSKARDKHCKCGYLEEKELIKQFQDLIDKIDLDEIGMKEKIESEIVRFKHFQRGVLGVKDKVEVGEVDIRNYAKYMLRDGTDLEKRELLSCFKSNIYLQKKLIIINKT